GQPGEPREVLLKRAADLVEALYGMPHNNQVSHSCPFYASTWVPPRYRWHLPPTACLLALDLGRVGVIRLSAAERVDSAATRRCDQLEMSTVWLGYSRNTSSVSPRGYVPSSTPQQSNYNTVSNSMNGYGNAGMPNLGVPGSPGFLNGSSANSPYGSKSCSSRSFPLMATVLVSRLCSFPAMSGLVVPPM
uniref:Transcription factor COE helix-loop-helix domain-containing protein n=1 Tax=Monodelphis domestica TaxID=13616 RepID=H9H917_MONDO